MIWKSEGVRGNVDGLGSFATHKTYRAGELDTDFQAIYPDQLKRYAE